MKAKKKLFINKKDKKFLGVIAGLADYLEVSVVIIRIVFIISILFGGFFLLPAYFIFYFCLDGETGGFKASVTEHSVFRHFKNVDYKKKIYRNRQEQKLLGICSGLADYFEVDAMIVRIAVVSSFFIAGPIPWIAYFASYFLLDVKPSASTDTIRERHAMGNKWQWHKSKVNSSSVDGDRSSRSGSRSQIRYCTRKFGNLHGRLIRMEAYVTSKSFKLQQEFKNIK